jgi:hypothetical protein
MFVMMMFLLHILVSSDPRTALPACTPDACRRVMHHLFVIWHWCVHCIKKQRAVLQAKEAAILTWRTLITTRLMQAVEEQHSSEIWECARLLGGGKMGRRRRWKRRKGRSEGGTCPPGRNFSRG